eukprot:3498206-Prymnesium_polylepis.1
MVGGARAVAVGWGGAHLPLRVLAQGASEVDVLRVLERAHLVVDAARDGLPCLRARGGRGGGAGREEGRGDEGAEGRCW